MNAFQVGGLDQENRIRVFLQQASEVSVTYRLAFAQREMRNYLVLEREFDLLWESMRGGLDL
jgi:hypothetical protein